MKNVCGDEIMTWSWRGGKKGESCDDGGVMKLWLEVEFELYSYLYLSKLFCYLKTTMAKHRLCYIFFYHF